ncbi:MAG TPA: fluoride efflux transporter CrcB [Candidatus Bathyarchaeia archaeon]|nr:fluoride efflux transporter CrcB [Candidatus Bathyarchaeia archaeon]
MLNVVSIALGGAIGAVARYSFGGWLQQISRSGIFPWGTLGVNLIGAFVIGVIWGISDRFLLSTQVRLFLMVGVLGGFTTFSTFCLENLNMLRAGETRMVLWNIGLSNILGLVLVYAGFKVMVLCQNAVGS